MKLSELQMMQMSLRILLPSNVTDINLDFETFNCSNILDAGLMIHPQTTTCTVEGQETERSK